MYRSCLSKRKYFLSVCAFSLLAGTGSTGFAQEEEKVFSLEEIVVTARKRAESLQDVPVSVSAFSENDIEAKSLNSLNELSQFTPNFNFSNQGQAGSSGAVMYIRGIGQSDPNVYWDPGVGVYIDGVYMGRMQGVDFDLMSLERVEILRGPQGTLFGKNTIGGAVNIVTKTPGYEFEGQAELTAGSYDRIDGKLHLNIPLVQDKMALSVSGATRNSDGYGTRIDYNTGEKIDEMGNRNRLTGRAKLYWQISDNFDALFSVEAARIREYGAVRDVVAIGQPALIGLLNSQVDPDYTGANFYTADEFTSYADGANKNDLDAFGASMTLNWDLGEVQLKSITAYRDVEAENGTDPDGSFYHLIDLVQKVDQDQFSQEFQVTGVSFDDRLSWVAGLYYFEESGYSNEILGVQLEVYENGGPDLSFTRNILAETKSYAAYGQGTFAISDKLDFTAGIRYSYEEKDVTRERIRHVSGDPYVPLGSASESFSAFSPRASFEYHWNEDLMTYVSVARGFKSGGINGNSFTSNDFEPFDPEYVWTYEAGLRSEFFQRRMQLNLSAFYSDYSDIQYTILKGDPVTGASITLVDNAAKARIQGIELEMVAMPLDALLFNVGIGYVDAKYTDIEAGADITEATRFTKTPEWTISASAKYTVELSDDWELVGNVDWAYSSSLDHDTLNSPNGFQGDYSIVNARLTLNDLQRNLSLAVFVTNLTDTRYILGATDFTGSLGFADVQWARPREWGVSLKYQF